MVREKGVKFLFYEYGLGCYKIEKREMKNLIKIKKNILSFEI